VTIVQVFDYTWQDNRVVPALRKQPGTVDGSPKEAPAMTNRTCIVDGCDKPHASHGYCDNHAYHFRRYGDPLAYAPPKAPTDPFLRIMASVELVGSCWIPRGSDPALHQSIAVTLAPGVKVQDRKYRVVYRELVGPIAAGHVLHHECRVPGCVNPAHLRAVSAGEHRRIHIDEAPAPPTHCVKCGSDEWKSCGPGRRQCRQCFNRRRKELRAERRQAELARPERTQP